ncbi:hypothetical protein [Aeromicrobium sp. CnD17-E]|uniref:hypothetical protein n=1 Tax=Aeromicrobium sp. CnD17-E TaxID=2954487 RepID=UPI002096E7BE|nr:hypothetical protein [Aeromicrobium sp. CnD17-E]MCO7239037.1 hypothetical protein [Aeromicrobium sp. CnD17-E]
MAPRALLAAGAVTAALVAGCTSTVEPGGGESFSAATLPTLDAPSVSPPPRPDVRRTMSAAATLTTFEAPLDACRGPVAIDVGEAGRPLLVSEHDYCGGAAWIPGLGRGDVVELDGPGVDAGLYRVDVVDRHQRRDVFVRDLRPSADVVLQTCVSQTQLVLVALTKVPRQDV